MGWEWESAAATIVVARDTDSGKTVWTIRVEDTKSGTTVVEVEMDGEQFAQALSHTHAKARYRHGPPELWGTDYEWEHVTIPAVPVSERGSGFAEAFDALTAHLNVDGWRVDREKTFNGHRVTETGGYQVVRRRYLRDGEPVELS